MKNSFESSTIAVGHRIFVPCPNCEHNNLPSRKPVETCKMYLADKLPACRKCGKPLKNKDIRGLPDTSVYMKRARAELGIPTASVN